MSTTALTSSAESDSDMCTNCQTTPSRARGSAASAQSHWWFVPHAAIRELQIRWNSAGVVSLVAQLRARRRAGGSPSAIAVRGAWRLDGYSCDEVFITPYEREIRIRTGQR